MWSDKTFEEYTELATSGDPQAQIFLGDAYMRGEDIDRDDDKAIYWFGKAEDQGNLIASFRLAFILTYKNRQEGLERLLRLKAKQFSPASYELGNCFYMGLLTPRNEQKAAGEWTIAAESGHLLAKMKMEKYKQERAKIWLKPIYFLRALIYMILSMSVICTDSDDIRVLGSLR